MRDITQVVEVVITDAKMVANSVFSLITLFAGLQ